MQTGTPSFGLGCLEEEKNALSREHSSCLHILHPLMLFYRVRGITSPSALSSFS